MLSGRTRQRPPMPSSGGSGTASGQSQGRRCSSSRQSRGGALGRGGAVSLGGGSPQPPAPSPRLRVGSGTGCVGEAGACHPPPGRTVGRGASGYSPYLPSGAASPSQEVPLRPNMAAAASSRSGGPGPGCLSAVTAAAVGRDGRAVEVTG